MPMVPALLNWDALCAELNAQVRSPGTLLALPRLHQAFMEQALVTAYEGKAKHYGKQASAEYAE